MPLRPTATKYLFSIKKATRWTWSDLRSHIFLEHMPENTFRWYPQIFEIQPNLLYRLTKKKLIIFGMNFWGIETPTLIATMFKRAFIKSCIQIFVQASGILKEKWLLIPYFSRFKYYLNLQNNSNWCRLPTKLELRPAFLVKLILDLRNFLSFYIILHFVFRLNQLTSFNCYLININLP